MVLVLKCSEIRCEHKFAINAGLVRQFNAIKKKSCLRALGVTILKNMIENVNVCFEVHIETN